jgi:hypothetical protein
MIPRTSPHDREWDSDDIEALEEPFTEDDLIERNRDLKEGQTDSLINEALGDDPDDLRDVL